MNAVAAGQRQRAIELLSLKTRVDLGRLVQEFGELRNDQARKHAVLDEARRMRGECDEFFRRRLAAGSDVDITMLEISHRAMHRLAEAVTEHERRYDDATAACESKRDDVARSMARENRLEILHDEAGRLGAIEADRRMQGRIEERWLQRGASA